jgi:nitrate/TMAO reductase-like tetraheme cytochrome c subunit
MFIVGIVRSKLSLVGATMVTVVFPFMAVAILLELQGVFHSPYFGFVLYMVMGPIFILGLILTFVGLFLRSKEDVGLFTFNYLREQFSRPEGFLKIRKLIALVAGLTLVNIVVILLLSYTGYHYTESNEFCGTLCHTVMEPEYTTYQQSPHSRVNCVSCHIGGGAQWFVKAKISGTRQLAAVVLNTYSKPIPTPVHGLRPASDTCEQCHRPEYFHGEKLKVIDKYREDEKNTHVQTVLVMKIGSGGYLGSKPHGIHWHVAPENDITYVHTDEAREEITEVRLTNAQTGVMVYSNGDGDSDSHGKTRQMDCIDCHNRPTHVYLEPDQALDRKMKLGIIPDSIPYIKKKAMEMVTKEYGSHEEAKIAIADELSNWYRENYPDVVQSAGGDLDRAITGIQAAYTENVWPKMNITWSTYKNNLGHRDELGCFRCHDEEHETPDGEIISMDCEACHIILAEEEKDPEILESLGI